ncbi:MAG: hypothetical protein ACXVB1_16095 [Pseudobdellovibrionaceae bacterium]
MKAEVLQKIEEYRAKNMSWKQIERKIVKDGIRNAQGGIFKNSYLQNIYSKSRKNEAKLQTQIEAKIKPGPRVKPMELNVAELIWSRLSVDKKVSLIDSMLKG